MSDKHTAIYLRAATMGPELGEQHAIIDPWAVLQNQGSLVPYWDLNEGATVRSGWKKLMDQVEAGRISRVVVSKLDRIADSQEELNRVAADLRAKGVELFCLGEPVPPGLGDTQGVSLHPRPQP